MTEQHFSKADGDEIESVTLVFDLSLSDFERKMTNLSHVRSVQEWEAACLERALYNAMPGGVYDQLLAAMMTRKVSLLRVRHERIDDAD